MPSVTLLSELPSSITRQSHLSPSVILNTSNIASNAALSVLPPGLHNLGNTCYLNSVLQVLYHIPAFKNAILSWPGLPNRTHSDALYFASDLVESLRVVFEQLDRANAYANSLAVYPPTSSTAPLANHDSSASTEPPSTVKQSELFPPTTPHHLHPQDLAASNAPFSGTDNDSPILENANHVPASHPSTSIDPLPQSSNDRLESPELPSNCQTQSSFLQHPMLPLDFRTISYHGMDLDDDDDDDYEPAEATDDEDADDEEEEEDEDEDEDDLEDDLCNDPLNLHALSQHPDPNPVLVNDLINNPIKQTSNIDVNVSPSHQKINNNTFLNTSMDAEYELREGIDYVAPRDIICLLRNEDRCLEFDARGQQDAHEFLRFLLDKVNDCMQELAKPVSNESSPDSAHSVTPVLVKTLHAPTLHSSARDKKRPHSALADPDDNFEQKGVPRSPLDDTASSRSDPVQKKAMKENGGNATRSSPVDSAKNTAKKCQDPKTTRQGVSKRKRPIEEADTSSRNFDGNFEEKLNTLGSEQHLAKKPRGSEAHEPSAKDSSSAAMKDLVSQLFGGKSVMATRCDECEVVKERAEQFLDVSLPVEADKNLAWALSSHGEPEQLRGDNKYQCDKCQTHCEAKRWWQLAELPHVLTVHLKLFAFDEPISGAGGKVPVAMSCPMRMNFGDWCSPKCDESDDEYRLTSVIVHEGTAASSGHYYSYVYRRESDEWYCFDDSAVSQIGEDELSKTLFTSMRSCRTAYLLFYTRVGKGGLR